MDNDRGNEHDYALAGKIMLIAIVILFIVILIMLCLHAHVRMYLQRARHRRQQRTRRVPGPQFIFYVNPATLTGSATRGLDAAVISSLPVFNFSPKTHPNTVLECSVCLSEFENGETGRVLPKCNHSFHIGCIDKWLRSHTACPLCRAPVEPTPDKETRHQVTVDLCETDPGSSSGLNRSGPVISSSSCSINGKPSSLVGVTVEVPARNGGESSCDSPSTSSSFRSPMSRVLSFTRILSRERKASVSPSSGCVVVCGSGTELDAERGVRVETQ